MGIHSGFPTVNEANYIGLAVHTTARICAAAHGGQISCRTPQEGRRRGKTRKSVRFRNLGEHALRGLPAPVALFQMGAPGLDSSPASTDIGCRLGLELNYGRRRPPEEEPLGGADAVGKLARRGGHLGGGCLRPLRDPPDTAKELAMSEVEMSARDVFILAEQALAT